MLTKVEVNDVRKLNLKKNRISNQLFVAEGPKMIQDLIRFNHPIKTIYTTDIGFFSNVSDVKIKLIATNDLARISQLKTPNTCLALVHMPKQTLTYEQKELILVLDRIRDPGNLGTIIRLCDWFGVKTIICSPDSVDCYNPKVVQATMGAIANVAVFYSPLPEVLQNYSGCIYGTCVTGDAIYKTPVIDKPEGLLVMGNEAQGICPTIRPYINHMLGIPKADATTSESLNLSMATAIVLSEFFRRGY